MVDYSFVGGPDAEKKSKPKKTKKTKPEAKRVDVVLEDLSDSVPAKAEASPLVLAKKVMAKWDDKIEEIGAEMDAMVLEGDDDLIMATEMVGQGKTIVNSVTEAGKKYSMPLFREYKEINNYISAITTPILNKLAGLQKKINDYVRLQEYKRLEEERKQREAAAAAQAAIDAERARQQAAEDKAAKAQGREAVEVPKIEITAPVVPVETKTVTEHGSLKTEKVTTFEIKDLKSTGVLDIVLKYGMAGYRALAEQCFRKAIKSGAVGCIDADGYRIYETLEAKHRRR